MNEEEISSSMITGSIRSIASANVRCPPPRPSDERLGVDERFLRVLLDELAAGLHVFTHEDAEHPVGSCSVLQRDLLEHAALRVHRRFPELLGLHLGEALEPLDLHL